MTTETGFQPDEYVVLDHELVPDSDRGQVFTVTKVNKTTVDLTPVSSGRAARAPMYAVRHATAEEIAAAKDAAQTAPPLFLGSVVAMQGREGQHVVIALPTGNSQRYRIVPLGGTTDGSYTLAPREHLTLITLDAVA